MQIGDLIRRAGRQYGPAPALDDGDRSVSFTQFDELTDRLGHALLARGLRAGDRRDPTAAAKREHRTAEEQFRYENHVRYMIPLDPQLDYLRAAGFEGVDVYW